MDDLFSEPARPPGVPKLALPTRGDSDLFGGSGFDDVPAAPRNHQLDPFASPVNGTTANSAVHSEDFFGQPAPAKSSAASDDFLSLFDAPASAPPANSAPREMRDDPFGDMLVPPASAPALAAAPAAAADMFSMFEHPSSSVAAEAKAFGDLLGVAAAGRAASNDPFADADEALPGAGGRDLFSDAPESAPAPAHRADPFSDARAGADTRGVAGPVGRVASFDPFASPLDAKGDVFGSTMAVGAITPASIAAEPSAPALQGGSAAQGAASADPFANGGLGDLFFGAPAAAAKPVDPFASPAAPLEADGGVWAPVPDVLSAAPQQVGQSGAKSPIGSDASGVLSQTHSFSHTAPTAGASDARSGASLSHVCLHPEL